MSGMSRSEMMEELMRGEQDCCGTGNNVNDSRGRIDDASSLSTGFNSSSSSSSSSRDWSMEANGSFRGNSSYDMTSSSLPAAASTALNGVMQQADPNRLLAAQQGA